MNPELRVLIIEDDPLIGDGLQAGLRNRRVVVQQGQAQRKGQNGLEMHLEPFGGRARTWGTRLATSHRTTWYRW